MPSLSRRLGRPLNSRRFCKASIKVPLAWRLNLITSSLSAPNLMKSRSRLKPPTQSWLSCERRRRGWKRQRTSALSSLPWWPRNISEQTWPNSLRPSLNHLDNLRTKQVLWSTSTSLVFLSATSQNILIFYLHTHNCTGSYADFLRIWMNALHSWSPIHPLTSARSFIKYFG